MRYVQLSEFGGPDVFEVVETATPNPQSGEVLVRVHAAGVNFFEVLMRQNRYAVTPDLPMHPGVEVAGVIEMVGDGSASHALGSRVAVPLFAMARSGGYADHVLVDASSTVPLPDGLSFEDAVALMVQGLTALHSVRRSPPQDKAILVPAAGGGVGSLLVQLARSSGAKLVVTAASSPEKLKLAMSLGADIAVDYTEPDWTDRVLEITDGNGVDIVYDFVGGDMTQTFFKALASGGEIVFGALGRFDVPPLTMEALLGRNQSVKGLALLPLLKENELKADLEWLFHQSLKGRLKVTHGGRYALENVGDAHLAIESRRTTGKVVLLP